MNVVGYCRVSTAAQGDKYGLEAQQSDIKKWCKIKGHVIVGWYIDRAVSGIKEDRPELNRLLYGHTPKIDAVIVGKSDRIARKIELYYAIKHELGKKGIDLISVKEDFEGIGGQFKPILEAMIAALAEVERANITQRTMAGCEIKASQGGYSGGIPPYGYKVVDKRLVIDEREKEIVLKIFELRKKGEPLRKIADQIGLTRVGTKFTAAGVKSILDNEKTYRGYYRYGRNDWVKGEHEPILKAD